MHLDTALPPYPDGWYVVAFSSELQPGELITRRFAGQDIAAVAAVNEHVADKALSLIDVSYEPQPFVVDLNKAMLADAPLVFKERRGEEVTSNVRKPSIYPRDADPADVDAILENSAHTAEGVYRTQVQTHSPIETHGLVARWENNEHLTVWASTQATFGYRDNLADYFGIPKSNVRVITKFMGGGFGSKLKAHPHAILAVKLARKTGKPVRLMLDRKEEHLNTGNRPDSLQHIKIGTDEAG